MTSKDLSILEKNIGYTFKDKDILTRTLMHKSAPNVHSDRDHYERLEFLGDRILGLVVSDQLLIKFQDEKEGQIAKRHSALVSRDTVLKIAADLDLGSYLIASNTAYNEEGNVNDSILADLVESMIGGIYRDGGFDQAKDFVIRNWKDLLDQDWEVFDPKTRLQEWAQARGLPVPSYELIEKRGVDHNPEFVIEGTVEGLGKAQGVAHSKKQAQKFAAEKLLEVVDQGSHD